MKPVEASGLAIHTQGRNSRYSEASSAASASKVRLIGRALAVAAVCDGVEVAVFEHDERFVGFFPFERDRRNVGRPVAWRLSDMNGVVVDSQIDWSVEHLMQATRLSA